MTDKWKLVPIEPTDEMIEAYLKSGYAQCFFLDAYKAMLNAAPTPPNTITIPVDAEIETIKQMISECQHAQMVGSEWYTKGASGLYQHIAEWLRKGRTAINAIDKARSEP